MADEAAPPMPKLELKMIVPFALLFLTRQLDMKDPQIISYCQMGLGCSLVLVLTIYFYVWNRIQSQKDITSIWVPPKPAPAMPFSPPPAAPKPEDFVKTTYQEHESALVREVATGLLFSCGIAIFMSFKFNVHISCLIQAVMLPLGVFDSLPAKKHLGLAKGLIYGELLSNPASTKEEIKDKEKKTATEKVTEKEKKPEEPIESID